MTELAIHIPLFIAGMIVGLVISLIIDFWVKK